MVQKILDALQEHQVNSVIKRYEKINEVKPYIGVPMGAINTVSKTWKKHPEYFMSLWETGVLEAQYVAINIVKPAVLTEEMILNCLQETVSINVLDKFVDKVLSKRSDRHKWKVFLKNHPSPILQRLGWGLEVRYIVSKQMSEEEIVELFMTIQETLVSSPEVVKWVMNRALVELAVNYPEWLGKCVTLGETLGVYKEMKVPKGCTSAYAPEWIAALIKNRKIVQEK